MSERQQQRGARPEQTRRTQLGKLPPDEAGGGAGVAVVHHTPVARPRLRAGQHEVRASWRVGQVRRVQ